jgi:hypothetical protein
MCDDVPRRIREHKLVELCGCKGVKNVYIHRFICGCIRKYPAAWRNVVYQV